MTVLNNESDRIAFTMLFIIVSLCGFINTFFLFKIEIDLISFINMKENVISFIY